MSPDWHGPIVSKSVPDSTAEQGLLEYVVTLCSSVYHGIPDRGVEKSVEDRRPAGTARWSLEQGPSAPPPVIPRVAPHVAGLTQGDLRVLGAQGDCGPTGRTIEARSGVGSGQGPSDVLHEEEQLSLIHISEPTR